MKNLISVILITGLTLNLVTAHAHHSFASTFTDERETTIEGVVTGFSFRNPHILVYVDVTNEDGSVTGWVTEGVLPLDFDVRAGQLTPFNQVKWCASRAMRLMMGLP